MFSSQLPKPFSYASEMLHAGEPVVSSCMFRISMVDDITVTVGWHRSFIRAGGGCFRILNSLALATVNPNPRLPRSKSHYYLRRRILGIREQEFSQTRSACFVDMSVLFECEERAGYAAAPRRLIGTRAIAECRRTSSEGNRPAWCR